LFIKEIDSDTGMVSGSFCSPSGTTGQEFPLIGWINTQTPKDGKDNVVVVSFSVRWGKIGSVTAWNGYYALEEGKATIVGQWFLSRPNADLRWEHIVVGQDRFTKPTDP
jgi:hypothetical protein